MLSTIYFRKKIGFPYLSFIFILSCWLVSIPTYLYPKLYFILGGMNDPFYFWQHITFAFEHGSIAKTLYGNNIGEPILVHLMGNSLLILVFGVLTERILGTKRFILLSTSAFGAYFILGLLMNTRGNGASGITYAYPPVIFFVLIYLYKLYQNKVFKDTMFYVSGFVFATSWIMVTIVYFLWNNLAGNLTHLTATLIGIGYTYIWRRKILERVKEITQSEYANKIGSSVIDKKIIKYSYTVPAFIILILVLVLTGVLKPNYISPATVQILPVSNSILAINENRDITLKFNQPMSDLDSINYSIDYLEDKGEVTYKLRRINKETFSITFNRDFYLGEKVNIVINQIFDAKGRIYNYGDIILNYE